MDPLPPPLRIELSHTFPAALPAIAPHYSKLAESPRAGGITHGYDPERPGRRLTQYVNEHVANIIERTDEHLAANPEIRHLIPWHYARAIAGTHDLGEAGEGDLPQSASPDSFDLFHQELAAETGMNRPNLVTWGRRPDGTEGTILTPEATQPVETAVQGFMVKYYHANPERASDLMHGTAAPEEVDAMWEFIEHQMQLNLTVRDEEGRRIGPSATVYRTQCDAYWDEYVDRRRQREQHFAENVFAGIEDRATGEMMQALYDTFEGRGELAGMELDELVEKYRPLFPDMPRIELRMQMMALGWYMRSQDISEEITYFVEYGGWRQDSYPAAVGRTREELKASMNKSILRMMEPAIHLMHVLPSTPETHDHDPAQGPARSAKEVMLQFYDDHFRMMQANSDFPEDARGARAFLQRIAEEADCSPRTLLAHLKHAESRPWIRPEPQGVPS
jgi:hypothetical protein